MELHPHQKRAVERNGNYELWCWATRTGKTAPACLWSNNETRNANSIVVCLKSNKRSWQKQAPHATVYTKEEFKKVWETIDTPSSIVVDEAHFFASPLFVRGRSQLATALYSFIKKWPDMHVLLLSATPIRNDPSSLHTLLCYIRVLYKWEDWRAEFYNLEYKPYLPRPAWMPRKDWRIRIRAYLEKYADIVTLADVVANLPPETHEVIRVKTGKYEYKEDEDKRWTTEHLHEQSEKHKVIKELGDKYRKLIIVCKYTEQILDLEKKLKTQKPVFVLSGQTKDQEKTIEAAQASDDCYLIMQASMGAGFDGVAFDAMVFASMDHAYVSYVQAIGRLHHTIHIKPAIYYYLLSTGSHGWDKKVYDAVVQSHHDFTFTGFTQDEEAT
jgi:superfamily II DNA or RNA helicase